MQKATETIMNVKGLYHKSRFKHGQSRKRSRCQMPSIFCLIKNILLFQLITCTGHLTVNVIQTSIVTWCDLLTNIRNFQCVHFVCAHAFWVYVKPTAFCHCSNVVCLKKIVRKQLFQADCTLYFVVR